MLLIQSEQLIKLKIYGLNSNFISIKLFTFNYSRLQSSTKWSFGSFRSEFCSVKFIERWDFLKSLFWYFSLTLVQTSKQKNRIEVRYWTVYNSFNFRYYSVVYPLEHKITMYKGKLMIVYVWCHAVIISLPKAIVGKVITVTYPTFC